MPSVANFSSSTIRMNEAAPMPSDAAARSSAASSSGESVTSRRIGRSAEGLRAMPVRYRSAAEMASGEVCASVPGAAKRLRFGGFQARTLKCLTGAPITGNIPVVDSDALDGRQEESMRKTTKSECECSPCTTARRRGMVLRPTACVTARREANQNVAALRSQHAFYADDGECFCSLCAELANV